MNINTKLFDEMSDEDFFSNKLTHIYFNENVTDDSVTKLIETIREANIPKYNERILLKPKPILIHISSMGGSITAGMRLMSVYALSKVPIATIVDNYSCSAATFLSISSHYRLITKYGYCLIHEYSLKGIINSRQQEITNYVNLVDTYFDKIIEMYLEQTKFQKQELKELLQHDLLLDSDFCLKKGIVDRVIDIKRDKPKDVKITNIYDIIQNYNYNNITISCKEAIYKLDKIIFQKDISPVIIYPRRFNCNETQVERTIFDTLNLIPRIKNIDAPTYAVIEGPISIDDLLPILYCDHIIMFDHAYIVSNILYFHNKIGFLLSDNIKNTELIFDIIKKVLKEKTSMSVKQIEDINSKFSIINAAEAKKLGLCNDIIKYHRQNQKISLELRENPRSQPRSRLSSRSHSRPKSSKNSNRSLR